MICRVIYGRAQCINYFMKKNIEFRDFSLISPYTSGLISNTPTPSVVPKTLIHRRESWYEWDVCNFYQSRCRWTKVESVCCQAYRRSTLYARIPVELFAPGRECAHRACSFDSLGSTHFLLSSSGTYFGKSCRHPTHIMIHVYVLESLVLESSLLCFWSYVQIIVKQLFR